MTLSPVLVDTYLRYKRGTLKFVNWLATAAKGTGAVDHLLSDTSISAAATQPTTRLKGKARAEAKKKKAVDTQPTAIDVPLKTFQQLANSIVAARRTVPDTILSILTDVINARKECATFYKALGTGADGRFGVSNNRHQYFIKLLEKVYRTLKPHVANKEREPATKTEQRDEEDFNTLTNMFEYLEVEECKESKGSSPTPSLTPAKAKDIPTYKLEPSAEDISFAIFCFLKDCNQVRLLVHQTWREYKFRRVSLTTAALTMNAAVEIFRQLHESFVADYPDFKDHAKIVDFIYTEGFQPKTGGSGDSGRNENGWFRLDGFTLSAQTLVCERAYKMCFEDVILQGPPGENKITFLQTDDTQDKRTFWGERTLLSRFLSQLSFMSYGPDKEFGDGFRNLDMLIKAYRETRATGKALPWAVFAFQTFVDMHRELGNDTRRGFAELQKSCAWMLGSMKSCYEFGKTNRCNEWHKINDPVLRTIIEMLTAFSIDDFFAIEILPRIRRANKLFRSLEPSLQPWGSHSYLKDNPTFCGILLQKFFLHFHELGVGLAGDNGAVLGMVHLYNFATQHNLLSPNRRWQDLEYLIENHGDSYMFVGKRPETTQDCLVQYALVLGVNLHTFTTNDPHKLRSVRVAKDLKSFKSKAQPRRLKHLSTYVSEARVVGGIGKSKTTRASEEPAAMVAVLVAKHLDSMEDKNNKRENAKRVRILTPLQTLETFRDALRQDEFSPRFNYMSLNVRCIELYRRLYELVPLHDEGQYAADGNIPLLTSTIFDTYHVPENRSGPISKVWPVIDAVVKAEGDVECNAAEKDRRIGAGVDHHTYEDRSTEFVFGGVNSPEDRNMWPTLNAFGPNQIKIRPDLSNSKEWSRWQGDTAEIMRKLTEKALANQSRTIMRVSAEKYALGFGVFDQGAGHMMEKTSFRQFFYGLVRSYFKIMAEIAESVVKFCTGFENE
ncbi:hypothetical protein BDV96DRAFT_653398 [Lophiotrema nucula]|uniref:DUF6604 domain-containing protein n=1 Tax=Lophiotrema nucula TaxID=690887 RepID=A0A6A5YNG0_9PLEO|nr:hypothetical protein BDV96DRAFT_653398 [Lophiotrema nucula]